MRVWASGVVAAALNWWVNAAILAADFPVGNVASISAAAPGDVIHFGELTRDRGRLASVPLQITELPGPQFLLSDHPEYFRSNGIAMQETVKPGLVRLYVYHVPEPAEPKKIVTGVIENIGANEISVRFHRRAFPTPGRDYPRVVKTALFEFFQSSAEKIGRSIPQGGAMALDPRMDETPAGRDELVHGFYEFEVTGPARVTIFQKSQGQDSRNIFKTLPALSVEGRGNGAGRGLFSTAERAVRGADGFTYDTAMGPMRLIVADGKSDPWSSGLDGLTGKPARDAGNYGLTYHIEVSWKSSDQRGLAVLMTRVGSSASGCGNVGAAVQVLGKGMRETVLLPKERTGFGSPGEAALIMKCKTPAHGAGVIDFIYSPPGAACMPTPFLLVPID